VTRPARSAARADLRLDAALWRAVSLFRCAALLYAAVAVLASFRNYRDRDSALLVLLAMAAWTAVMVLRTPPPRALLAVDLLVTLAAQQSTLLILSRHQIDSGHPTITVCWAAAPVAK